MAAPQNDWQLGTMYRKGLLNGTPFFSQSAPFQKVFPTNQNNVPWPEWPGAGSMTINECSNWVNPGCLHVVKNFCIIQEFDYVLNQPVQLITCPTCSYIQRAVYGKAQNGMPELYDPYLYCVIVG